MIELNDFLFIIGGAIIGFAACYFIMLRAHSKLKNNLLAHETRQAIEKELSEKSKTDEEKLMQSFRDSFAALSGQALRENNEEFLKLARENFSK
ncbi:recombinase RmuC, partial [Cycloclasticus sp. 44_32_T64]